MPKKPKLLSNNYLFNLYTSYSIDDLCSLSDKDYNILFDSMIKNKLNENFEIITKFREVDRLREKTIKI